MAKFNKVSPAVPVSRELRLNASETSCDQLTSEQNGINYLADASRYLLNDVRPTNGNISCFANVHRAPLRHLSFRVRCKRPRSNSCLVCGGRGHSRISIVAPSEFRTCYSERKCADTVGTVLVPGLDTPVLKYKYISQIVACVQSCHGSILCDPIRPNPDQYN